MFYQVLILHLILLTKLEIIDYTSHENLLFKNNKDVLTYDSYAKLFHVSFYKEIIKLESENVKILIKGHNGKLNMT